MQKMQTPRIVNLSKIITSAMLLLSIPAYAMEQTPRHPSINFSLTSAALIVASITDDPNQQQLDEQFKKAYEELDREKSLLLRLQGAQPTKIRMNNFWGNYDLPNSDVPSKELPWHAILMASTNEIIRIMPANEYKIWSEKLNKAGINNLHTLYAYMKLTKTSSLDKFFTHERQPSPIKAGLLKLLKENNPTVRRPDGTYCSLAENTAQKNKALVLTMQMP